MPHTENVTESQVFRQREPHPSERFSSAAPATVAADLASRIRTGDRTGAVRLLVEQVERGADPERLMREVVEPTEQHLVTGAATGAVTQEHLAHGQSVITLAKAMLRPPVFRDIPGV